MEDAFRLQIETHPETQLLQMLQLGPLHSVRILRLFDKYYLLERIRGEQGSPQLFDEPFLIKKLASGGLLSAEDIRPVLPPVQGIDILLGTDDDSSEIRTESQEDPLQSRLRNAMARFMEQNPATAQILAHTTSSVHLEHPESEPSVKPRPEPEFLVESVVSSSELELLTAPLVYEALQQAGENQQIQLQRVMLLKQEVEQETLKVTQSLKQVPIFQERLNALCQRIENWQSEMELHHVRRDSLLERTAEELEALQNQLQSILSEGLALQKIMRERQFHEHQEIALRLDCLEDMLGQIVQQRHWVYYLQQQDAFRELEQARLNILKQRRQDLCKQAQVLSQSIENMERINRELLEQDPLVVPEPVPALALHELLRLEHEIQVLEADPALKLLEEQS